VRMDNDQINRVTDGELAKEASPVISAKVMNMSQHVQEEDLSKSGRIDGATGGSVLGVLEEVIRVGQVMGNSLGNSGGILCIWEATVFKKDNVTVSDNFIAIYGTWLPSNSKVLFVVVYAPQQGSCKRALWDYMSILLGQWNGDVIMMGDFNEVRSKDERRGSWFNPSSSRSFDQFIASSGLVDVKMEGYTFTWSHPSATKMSKLDRFLVSDGIFLEFPSISALCLDRHLSDHRPILLHEIQSDFGPVPFRFYHSWFSFEGFDDMTNVIMMGDFNEVRSKDERRGSWFNPSSSRSFDQFIASSGLVDVKMEGYTFTWSHPSATKMSKLDRFLVSDGIFLEFPSISALCLDRHLSDHRPILLHEIQSDFGPVPFRFYHSWFSFEGFDDMDLKVIIKLWIKDKRLHLEGAKTNISKELQKIDKEMDSGVVSDTNRFRRLDLIRQLHDIKAKEATDALQKSKVRWAVEGDENSKFFHGVNNKRRSQLAIRGVFDDGRWCTAPDTVKNAFLNHFESRFKKPITSRLKLNSPFNKRLSRDQADNL
nr:RNA-directed DNA polymerase, eukaryota [Tanacetum cinerariifolium]